MVITESELREMWRDGRNALPAFPPGTRFSPAAQDFIKDHKLEIRLADPTPAVIPAPLPPQPVANHQLPVTNNQLPAALDTLLSLTMLVAAESRRYQLPALARRLDALAEYCLELRAAVRLGRDPAPLLPAPLLPAPASGSQELTTGPTDHAILHWLNFLRATARQTAAQASGSGKVKIAAALDQVSATAGVLGRQVQSGEIGWKSPMV